MEVIFAFASVPKDGGTFTFYRNLRPALLEYGIDMRCVAVGKAQAQLWEDVYADESCVLLAPKTRNLKKQAMVFAEWCEEEQVDFVMGINSEAILSALPHLPERIRVLSRCAAGFDHGYRITLSGRERLARVVALSPRLAKHLTHHYSANPSIMRLIPNGIDPDPFETAAKATRGQLKKLQLGFLGRLEHHHKGVLHLPKIVKELNKQGVSFVFHVAGKGKHRRVLEKEMRKELERGQVKFLGAIPSDEVPAFLTGIDVFIFPSHVEGCPNALLEAMMAGCVPIAWLIEGITDFILEDGHTGFICPTADYVCVAQHIADLSKDRKKLRAMSQQAANEARKRFHHKVAAKAYAELIKEVMAEPPPPWNPKPWEDFQPDPNFEHSWTEWLPFTWHRWLRKMKESYF